MYNVRKARIDDIPSLNVFQKKLHGEWFDSSHSDMEQGVADGRVWIAMEGETAIGYQLCELFGASQPNFPNSIFLSELFVAPEHRKKGIGRRLIEAALNNDWPEKFGYFALTHDPAEPLLTDYYKKFGFTECGKTDAGNIKMTRQR